MDFHIPNPQLWWPRCYGEQSLYEITIELMQDKRVLQTMSKKIGLRTLSIQQEKDQWGESFELIINGKTLFAMGANYIPQDNIIGRVGEDNTRKLLSDMLVANMNCVRVWGGGYYLEDYFYDLCDEMGLIVWQDLMFACSLYRANQEFMDSISVEITQQIRRIRHHACIGLICGNNEIEMGSLYWEGMKDCDPSLREDYVQLFERTIPGLVQQLAPQLFYWKSSPTSGTVFELPNDENRGDTHEWAVWHGLEPFSYYEDHYYRFLSEFGLQPYPELKTIESFT